MLLVHVQSLSRSYCDEKRCLKYGSREGSNQNKILESTKKFQIHDIKISNTRYKNFKCTIEKSVKRTIQKNFRYTIQKFKIHDTKVSNTRYKTFKYTIQKKIQIRDRKKF